MSSEVEINFHLLKQSTSSDLPLQKSSVCVNIHLNIHLCSYLLQNPFLWHSVNFKCKHSKGKLSLWSEVFFRKGNTSLFVSKSEITSNCPKFQVLSTESNDEMWTLVQRLLFVLIITTNTIVVQWIEVGLLCLAGIYLSNSRGSFQG